MVGLLQRGVRGAAVGAALGGFYFACDFAGAVVAIHPLMDFTVDAAMMILVAAVGTVAVGGALGAGVGLLWLWKLPDLRARLPGKVRWGAVLVAAVVIVGAGFGLRVERMVEPPNHRPPVTAHRPVPVLWMVIDTLRRDVALGESSRMPQLAKFFDQTLSFADAESTAGWTIPSVATLFTGIHTTTLDASAGFLPDWAPTAAEHLSAAGYETHAVVDNVVMEPRNGFAAGFDTWSQRSGFRFAFTFPAFRLMPLSWRDSVRTVFRGAYRGAPGLASVARDRIRSAGARPIFLYVHFMDPHAPYYPHPELAPAPTGAEPMNYYAFRDALRDGSGPPPSAKQLAWLKHRYDYEANYLDPHAAAVIEEWQRKFGEDSIIMVTVDHGEEFLDHGHLAHGLTVHREMVHVPLALHLPPRTLGGQGVAGRVVEEPVSQIDILPTVLEVLGVAPATPPGGPAIQGQSWLPWLRGQAQAPSRPLIASHSRHGRRTYRYREGDWVLTKTMFYDRRPTVRQLFNLADDPFEQRDVLLWQPERVADMNSRFEPLAKQLFKAFNPERPSESRANLESLRALGYIQ